MNGYRRLWFLLSLILLSAGCTLENRAADEREIRSLLHLQFDRPGAALQIAPVVVAGTYAIAGWTQGERGGRALLRQRDSSWAVVLCAGDALLAQEALEAAGVPPGTARQLARGLSDAESALSPDRRAQFGRFQGTVRMDAHGQHPPTAQHPAGVASALILDGTASQLNVVSIKNNTVAEVHRFAALAGRVSEQGDGRLEVGLDSVQTGIPVRDQRLREWLFETAQFPKATVTLAVDMALVHALPIGVHRVVHAEAQVDLHGVGHPLAVVLRVTRVDPKSWLVTSEQPVILDVTQFDLTKGIDQLRRAAGLQAIGSSVPVTFTLTFVER